jgi:hypothetical protein
VGNSVPSVAVCDSTSGSVLQFAQQCATVCGSAAVCQQCAAVCDGARGIVRQWLRAAVCGSASGSVRQ